MPGGGEKEEEKKLFEDTLTEKLPQINIRHQTRDPGSLENITQNKQPPPKKTPNNYG